MDVDEASYNINPQLIAKSITKKTKAIIAVHLYGNPADMDKINNLAQKYKLWLVEDAAQAHGAIYKGKKIGSLGNIACFSFFPAKNLGCFGDGGIVVTNSKKLADRVRLLKDHGRIEKYKHIEIGYGARLDNLQAAILRVKLKYLDKWNDRRRKIAEYYDKKLKDKYIIPQVLPDITSAYYAYTLRHPQRDMIIRKLNSRGIITGIYYPMPLHLQPAYKYLGYKKRDFPVTEKICREIFSIPLYPELSKSQIDQIISVLLD
ncbi:MAG: cell wall biogenesis regulatory protein [uncultured bacterium]|nr:MAG: cell wall biogenesis regulatory protein [uncultured bacterium]